MTLFIRKYNLYYVNLTFDVKPMVILDIYTKIALIRQLDVFPLSA